jgi:hypothetical protein
MLPLAQRPDFLQWLFRARGARAQPLPRPSSSPAVAMLRWRGPQTLRTLVLANCCMYQSDSFPTEIPPDTDCGLIVLRAVGCRIGT